MAMIAVIQRRNLTRDYESDDDKLEALKDLSHIRLDREKISKIEHLQLVKSATNLYLQQVS